MLPGPVNAELCPDPILSAAERFSGKIVDLHGGRTVTGPELARGREALAAAMARCGLAEGDRVVMAVANGPEFFATLLAILAGGGLRSWSPSKRRRRSWSGRPSGLGPRMWPASRWTWLPGSRRSGRCSRSVAPRGAR